MKKIIIALTLLLCLQPVAGAQVEYGAVDEATIEVLSLSISADKSSYKLGEAVRINVALQNIDRARRRRLFLSGADLVFEIKSKEKTRKSRSYSFPEQATTLRVNASVVGSVDIGPEFKEPGKYTISATYKGYLMEAPAIKAKEPTSNSLTITIVR